MPWTVQTKRWISGSDLSAFIANVDHVAIRITNPDATFRCIRRRIDFMNICAAQRLFDLFEIISRSTQSEMVKTFARAGVQECRVAFERSRSEMNGIVPRGSRSESKVAIEFFADRLVRHFESVMKKRCYCHCTSSSGRYPPYSRR